MRKSYDVEPTLHESTSTNGIGRRQRYASSVAEPAAPDPEIIDTVFTSAVDLQEEIDSLQTQLDVAQASLQSQSLELLDANQQIAELTQKLADAEAARQQSADRETAALARMDLALRTERESTAVSAALAQQVEDLRAAFNTATQAEAATLPDLHVFPKQGDLAKLTGRNRPLAQG